MLALRERAKGIACHGMIVGWVRLMARVRATVAGGTRG